MKTVTRHSIDQDNTSSDIAETAQLLEASLRAARKNPKGLNQLLLMAQDYAGYLSVTKTESPELCRSLHLMAQAAAAIFALASATEGEIEVPLGDDILVRFPATGPTGFAAPNNWLAGFFAAVICRDIAALTLLAEASVSVMRHSTTKAAEYLYLTVDTFQGIFKGEKDFGERLLAALEAADPVQLKGSPDYSQYVIVPELELIHAYIKRDEEGFNNVLYRALENHKKYWSHSERRLDPSGYLALGPLALATFAHTVNMAITVESAYLPPSLIQGGCQ